VAAGAEKAGTAERRGQVEKARLLRELHHRPGRPLVLPNAWDAVSARAFAAAGFPVVATSSVAVAAVLGYQDGGDAPGEEMLAAAARVARAVDVPVTADMEAGYGLTGRELAERLLEAGLAGCNLEDTDHEHGGLVGIGRQTERIGEFRATAGEGVVLNARVDVFLRGGDVEEAVERAQAYLTAGADCVYPILAPTAVIPELVKRIPGPVNAHVLADRPDFGIRDLIATGVARISYGGALWRRLNEPLQNLTTEISQLQGCEL
jgi:2-methylisocitrate lyase-like PEP mutase family enzyme